MRAGGQARRDEPGREPQSRLGRVAHGAAAAGLASGVSSPTSATRR